MIIMKRIGDESLVAGDIVIVPVIQDGEGRNVLAGRKLPEDPVIGGEPSFRIPVCGRSLSRKAVKSVGSVWTGTVSSLLPTGRIMYRPGRHEVIEVGLADLRKAPTESRFGHFRYRNTLVETETIRYAGPYVSEDAPITVLHRSFTLHECPLPEQYFLGLPELSFEEYHALGERVDRKLRRDSVTPETIRRVLVATARA